jgi:uncharacterized protein YcnI
MRRVAVVGTAAAAAVLLPALPALAHITTTPSSAPAGSTVVLTFHVPDEEANADTVKVDVRIPTDHPIAQLLVKPVPGWSISVRTVTLAKPLVTDDGKFTQAVSEVIWSGGRILPGQFQDFTVSADPLPTGVRQLAFKAIQTYSNGDVVRWIDLPQPGQPAPDHPAAILTLTTDTAAATATATEPTAGAAAAGPGSDGTARSLAAAGLAAGLLACLLALTVTRRGRRRPALAAGPGGTPPGDDRAGAPAVVTAGDQARAGGQAGTRGDQPGAKAAARQDQGAAGAKTGRRDQGPGGTKATASRGTPRRRG